MTLYVVAGMHRSGSTWMFNTVRLALMMAGRDVYATTAEPPALYDKDNPAPFHVVKTHAYRSSLARDAAYVMSSKRDLRDIAASMVRLGKLPNEPEPLLDFLQGEVKRLDQWRTYARLVGTYEEMIRDKVEYTRLLLRGLDIAGGATLVSREVEALQVPSREAKTYDPVTLLTPGHITDGCAGGYKDTLSQEVVEAIEGRFMYWLEQEGYVAREAHHGD